MGMIQLTNTRLLRKEHDRVSIIAKAKWIKENVFQMKIVVAFWSWITRKLMPRVPLKNMNNIKEWKKKQNNDLIAFSIKR